MLQFINQPNCIYYASSVDTNEKVLGNLIMKIPSEAHPHYEVVLSLPIQALNTEEKQILCNDMIAFIEKAQTAYETQADS